MGGLSKGNGLSISHQLTVPAVGLWSGHTGLSNAGGGGPPPTGNGLLTDSGVQIQTDDGQNITTSS